MLALAISNGELMDATRPSTLSSIFHQRCPVCDLKFAREAGYFVGAMYISYGIALLVIAFIAGLLWAATGWWITKDVIWAVILFLPLAPTITLFARILWIYLDQTLDPEMQ